MRQHLHKAAHYGGLSISSRSRKSWCLIVDPQEPSVRRSAKRAPAPVKIDGTDCQNRPWRCTTRTVKIAFVHKKTVPSSAPLASACPPSPNLRPDI
jgi:hypothetical protein